MEQSAFIKQGIPLFNRIIRCNRFGFWNDAIIDAGEEYILELKPFDSVHGCNTDPFLLIVIRTVLP